jgi:hypothetical protein
MSRPAASSSVALYVRSLWIEVSIPSSGHESAVPLCDRVGLQVIPAGRVAREHERVAGKLDAESTGAQDTALPVLGQDENSVGVQNDATVALVLGVLLPRRLAVLPDRSLNMKDAVGEVDVAEKPPGEETSL